MNSLEYVKIWRRRNFAILVRDNRQKRRQYNKASLKAIIYENPIPFSAQRNAKTRKSSIMKTFNKFKNAFAEQKLCKIFLNSLKQIGFAAKRRQFQISCCYWVSVRSICMRQVLVETAMSDELNNNNASLDLKPATSKCLSCVKLWTLPAQFIRTQFRLEVLNEKGEQ